MKQQLPIPLNVHFRDIEPATDLAKMIEVRIGRALGACRERLSRVVVQLSDENGPRGGMDTQCSVLIHLKRAPEVHVQCLAQTPFRAVARATRRAGLAVEKVLHRERDLRQRRPRSA